MGECGPGPLSPLLLLILFLLPPSLNLPSLYVPSFLLGLAASSGFDLGEKWLLIRGRAFGEGRESSVAGEGQSVEKGAESRLGE